MYLSEIHAPKANSTLQNAVAKMMRGYRDGLTATHNTCYAYAGAGLAKLNPPDATIRFWGLKASGIIVHGDALLPDGQVISDIPVEKYAPRGYELVATLPFADFKLQADSANGGKPGPS